MASIASWNAFDGFSAYCISKRAVVGITKSAGEFQGRREGGEG
jgi:NAD(P)-dependent dehydrogenase (short-subunit alcohol dehydrogenase family)